MPYSSNQVYFLRLPPKQTPEFAWFRKALQQSALIVIFIDSIIVDCVHSNSYRAKYDNYRTNFIETHRDWCTLVNTNSVRYLVNTMGRHYSIADLSEELITWNTDKAIFYLMITNCSQADKQFEVCVTIKLRVSLDNLLYEISAKIFIVVSHFAECDQS